MSDYFERVEAHLLDAVERRAERGRPGRGRGRGPARTRGGVASLARAGTGAGWPGHGRRIASLANRAATAGAVLASIGVALAAILLLHGRATPNDRASTAPAGPSLPSMLAVLRRSQTPDDAPPQVLASARTELSKAPKADAGTVVTSLVRLVATGPDGERLYIAPVRRNAARHGIVDYALVILTNADFRGVGRAYGATSQAIRDGSFYVQTGLSAVKPPASRGGSSLDAAARALSQRLRPQVRSLIVQIVPDGIASVTDSYATLGGRLAEVAAEFSGQTGLDRVRTIARPHDNVAFTELRGRLANELPASVVLRDGDGRVVHRAVPSTKGAGAVAPKRVCPGAKPSTPGGREVGLSGMPPWTRADVCRQLGAPLRAYRRTVGDLLMLYSGQTVIEVTHGKAGLQTHLARGESFPPSWPRWLPPARPPSWGP